MRIHHCCCYCVFVGVCCKRCKMSFIRSVSSWPAGLTHVALHVWNYLQQEILTKEPPPFTSRTLHMHTNTHMRWCNQLIELGETGLASTSDGPRQINGFVLTIPIKPLPSLLKLNQTPCIGRCLTTGSGIKKLRENPHCRWEKINNLASLNTATAHWLQLHEF